MKYDILLLGLFGIVACPSYSLPTISARQSSITRNDIQNGLCKPFTLIFARGTTELGNLGGIVGPPLVSELQKILPGGSSALAVQGVNYPANVAGFLAGGDSQGSSDMADFAAKSCAATKIILAGYRYEDMRPLQNHSPAF
ncbi:Cutinase [Dactylella cylindrospora]|nr:Cutinase [Dactylella cylindrospora]